MSYDDIVRKFEKWFYAIPIVKKFRKWYYDLPKVPHYLVNWFGHGLSAATITVIAVIIYTVGLCILWAVGVTPFVFAPHAAAVIGACLGLLVYGLREIPPWIKKEGDWWDHLGDLAGPVLNWIVVLFVL